MEQKVKYQIIKVGVGPLSRNQGAFSVNTDKVFKYITGIFVYCGDSYSTNLNLSMNKPMRIGGVEIFPEEFDTHLLFPRVENESFTRSVKTEAAGSRIEGSFDLLSTEETATILLILENE